MRFENRVYGVAMVMVWGHKKAVGAKLLL